MKRKIRNVSLLIIAFITLAIFEALMSEGLDTVGNPIAYQKLLQLFWFLKTSVQISFIALLSWYIIQYVYSWYMQKMKETLKEGIKEGIREGLKETED